MMHDDHELFDNFGAAPELASAEYAALRQGALDASFDYQGQNHFGNVVALVQRTHLHARLAEDVGEVRRSSSVSSSRSTLSPADA